jgi:hypothetical protein
VLIADEDDTRGFTRAKKNIEVRRAHILGKNSGISQSAICSRSTTEKAFLHLNLIDLHGVRKLA